MKLKLLLVLACLLSSGIGCSKSTTPGNVGDSCSQDTDCDQSLVCGAKVCQKQTTQLCRDDLICAGLGTCNSITRDCQCGAAANCDSKLANACTSNASGNYCTCGKNSACLTGSTCNTTLGQCTCTVDANCAAGQTCQSGICAAQSVRSCRDNGPCGNLGTCQSAAGSGQIAANGNQCYCGSNSDCSLANTQCVSSQCTCNHVAANKAANSCSTTQGWQCGNNAVCSGASDTCTDNTCGCGNSGSPCPFDEICTNGACVGSRHAFLTNSTYTPGTAYNQNSSSTTFASQADANQICNDLAHSAPLNYGGQWAAVLGDKTKSAYNFLAQANGKALDATRNIYLAADPTLQISGPLFPTANNSGSDFYAIAAWASIGFDPFWVSKATIYEIGTDGTCNNWVSGSADLNGNQGKHGDQWTSREMACNQPGALLCIELDQ
ncbi:MAG: hypothetical protein I8H75_02230 [Myxococcaceae bacterium]|nr:hypothetical protein [Myxococcaceae bacterium]MBH2006154.1 hypothetical protein [Myxococcaceae bacterium]